MIDVQDEMHLEPIWQRKLVLVEFSEAVDWGGQLWQDILVPWW